MKSKNLCLLLVMLLGSLFVFGCGSAANKDNVTVASATPSRIVDYGNGVYYFPNAEADFSNTLSYFIEKHPELELVSMAGDDTATSGFTCGYFVVFRGKQAEKTEK